MGSHSSLNMAGSAHRRRLAQAREELHAAVRRLDDALDEDIRERIQARFAAAPLSPRREDSALAGVRAQGAQPWVEICELATQLVGDAGELDIYLERALAHERAHGALLNDTSPEARAELDAAHPEPLGERALRECRSESEKRLRTLAGMMANRDVLRAHVQAARTQSRTGVVTRLARQEMNRALDAGDLGLVRSWLVAALEMSTHYDENATSRRSAERYQRLLRHLGEDAPILHMMRLMRDTTTDPDGDWWTPTGAEHLWRHIVGEGLPTAAAPLLKPWHEAHRMSDMAWSWAVALEQIRSGRPVAWPGVSQSPGAAWHCQMMVSLGMIHVLLERMSGWDAARTPLEVVRLAGEEDPRWYLRVGWVLRARQDAPALWCSLAAPLPGDRSRERVTPLAVRAVLPDALLECWQADGERMAPAGSCELVHGVLTPLAAADHLPAAALVTPQSLRAVGGMTACAHTHTRWQVRSPESPFAGEHCEDCGEDLTVMPRHRLAPPEGGRDTLDWEDYHRRLCRWGICAGVAIPETPDELRAEPLYDWRPRPIAWTPRPDVSEELFGEQ